MEGTVVSTSATTLESESKEGVIMHTVVVQNGDAVDNVPMEIMPSDVSHNHVILIIGNNPGANVDVSMVTARDKVGTTPTSLKLDKHVVIDVFEEGVKQVLKDSNGRSSYGPI
ncbi:hypothetical protein V6N11_069736 [Hibiscus sabdariffa]|uniref:Uncharacterized protein n=1 Tax=Hibiscus sabdariffa TaxID=183260 RepID=A0ABR2Q494_9ROSI